MKCVTSSTHTHIYWVFNHYFYFSICQNQKGHQTIPEICMTSKLLWSIECASFFLVTVIMNVLQNFRLFKLISSMIPRTPRGKSSHCWAQHKLSWHLLLQCISWPTSFIPQRVFLEHPLGVRQRDVTKIPVFWITALLPGASHGW